MSSLTAAVHTTHAAADPPTADDLEHLSDALRTAAPVLRMLCDLPRCASLAVPLLAAVAAVVADLGDDAVLAPDVFSSAAGHTYPTLPSGGTLPCPCAAARARWLLLVDPPPSLLPVVSLVHSLSHYPFVCALLFL